MNFLWNHVIVNNVIFLRELYCDLGHSIFSQKVFIVEKENTFVLLIGI
jgi:hypothetical protein